MTLFNTALMRQPMNWLTVGLMAMIFAIGFREVCRLIEPLA